MDYVKMGNAIRQKRIRLNMTQAAIYKLKHLDEKELNFVINMIDSLKN